ncbi:YafY family protein [Variovorax sp. PCZ-1]|uniref:helix-turn-helix transcriptional regulator n=1 Tax=Variovorax sp. PCZ-1 TaxID=2835533 RepID=UPI001BCC604D|nr:YafY family protein [Variovorax sp. PCZ-1]MBS7807827.1 YafY family transcriptional regulator [Variovorax sp. PCZ-1]
MQASRLLSMLMLLQSRGRMSAPALAQALEVSVRTVLRDVDELSAAGVPIWGDRGRNGGFQLKPGWSTQLTGLTEPEAQALSLAGLPSAATELGLGTAATSARLKMIAALPPEWREQASTVASRLHVDPVDWYRSAESPQALREVADAVWRNLCIRIRYESWRGVSTREVEPLGLVLKAGAWYLVARPIDKKNDKKEALTFRLLNILSVSATAKKFKRPASFDLAQHRVASTQRFEANLYRYQAHIIASPRAQTWLANGRVKSVALPARDQTENTPEGWVHVILPIESIEQGVRQLLGFGAQVQVIEPTELRSLFLQELANIKSIYEKNR